MSKINYMPSFLSREEFEKFIDSTLGFYTTSNDKEISAKIKAGNYYGSDDIYCIKAHNDDDLDIHFIRLMASIWNHVIELTREHGTKQEKTDLEYNLKYINNSNIPYPTRMAVIQIMMESDTFELVITEALKSYSDETLPEKRVFPCEVHLPKPE